MPWDRFAQLWVAILAVLGAAMALAAVLTPGMLRTVMGWLGPVGVVLGWVMAQVVFLIFLVLTPLLEALLARIQSIMAQNPLPATEPAPPPPPIELVEVLAQSSVLRYCLSTVILVTAGVMLYLLFARVPKRSRRVESEDAGYTVEGLAPGRVDLGLDRLAAWLARLGRFGIGNQLLAAVTVENIYANLTRLARRKGFARPPAEDPTQYLARLNQAFPDHSQELATITSAYVHVRYAERPISSQELAEVRVAYASVIAPPADAATEQPRGRIGNRFSVAWLDRAGPGRAQRPIVRSRRHRSQRMRRCRPLHQSRGRAPSDRKRRSPVPRSPVPSNRVG